MMKTKEHTKKLHQMNDLCIEKKKLDSRLNTLQNQQVCPFSSDPLSELGKLCEGSYSQEYQGPAFKQTLILDHFLSTWVPDDMKLPVPTL